MGLAWLGMNIYDRATIRALHHYQNIDNMQETHQAISTIHRVMKVDNTAFVNDVKTWKDTTRNTVLKKLHPGTFGILLTSSPAPLQSQGFACTGGWTGSTSDPKCVTETETSGSFTSLREVLTRIVCPYIWNNIKTKSTKNENSQTLTHDLVGNFPSPNNHQSCGGPADALTELDCL